AERGDDLLAHRGTFATAFNDLEIGAAAGGLLAEIHGAEPWERLMRGPHIISKKHRASQTKSKTTWHYIFAKSTPRSNNINDLPPVSGSQVLKISLGVPPARMGFGLSSRFFSISLSLLVGRKGAKAGHVGPHRGGAKPTVVAIRSKAGPLHLRPNLAC